MLDLYQNVVVSTPKRLVTLSLKTVTANRFTDPFDVNAGRHFSSHYTVSGTDEENEACISFYICPR